MSRKISQAGIQLIKNFEGCRLTAYKPVPTETYWTIGWGHYGPDVKAGMIITQAQADAMFLTDIVRYENPVNDLSLQLNQNQFDALVSFCYNCGAGNLRKLCLGRAAEQIAASMPQYNKGGGNVLAGLVRRRKAELELFNKAESGGDQKMKAADANAIIDKYLKPAWGAAKTSADKQEIGRLADELRVASGQPKQNG